MAWRCKAEEPPDGKEDTERVREEEEEKTEQFTKWSMGHATDIVAALSKLRGGRTGEERMRESRREKRREQEEERREVCEEETRW